MLCLSYLRLVMPEASRMARKLGVITKASLVTPITATVRDVIVALAMAIIGEIIIALVASIR